MDYDAETLAYFKALVEGHAEVSWHPWWRSNRERLEASLTHPEFLRLKFGKVDYAAKLLAQHGIPFEWSPQGRRERAWANLPSHALDEHGRPLQEFRDRAFNGAFSAFARGDDAAGNAAIEELVRCVREMADAMERSQELGDLQFAASCLYDEGEHAVAIPLLIAIARWKTDSDLEFPAVAYAQKKLTQINVSW